MAKKLVLGDFVVESLGVDFPDYFGGYGLGPNSKYSDCAYGIGDTEAEALDDCIEMMAQCGYIDIDEETEQRIRDEFGVPSEESARGDCEEDSEDSDCDGCDGPYYHVGIKWNTRDAQRLSIVRKLPGLQPLRFESYEPGPDGSWGYVTLADGRVSYGDFKSTDWNDKGEIYFYVPYASGSDYAGCLGCKSNAKVFLEEHGSEEWVHDVYGGYSTYAVAVRVSGLVDSDEDTFEEVCDKIKRIAECSVLDEEAHFALEMEDTDNQWNSWVADSFKKEVEEKFSDCDGGVDFRWPTDDVLRIKFEALREKAGCEWWDEGMGSGMYVRIEDIVKRIGLDDLADYIAWFAVVYNDGGEIKEDYSSEADSIARVEELRRDGFAGAYFRAE